MLNYPTTRMAPIHWTPGHPMPSSSRLWCGSVKTTVMQAKVTVNRIKLMEHLVSAARHVEDGQELIRRQRDRIYFLGKGGRDTNLAELVLARLEASQSLRIANLKQLEEMLSALAS